MHGTADHAPIDELEREQWPMALLALPRDRVLACAEALASRYNCVDRDLTRAGQHAFVVRDSVQGIPFQCGDLPLATAAIALTLADGSEIPGASMIARQDGELARAVAIIDAACSGAASVAGVDADQAWELLVAGHRQLTQERQAEQRLLEATMVDFSLLGSARKGDT